MKKHPVHNATFAAVTLVPRATTIQITIPPQWWFGHTTNWPITIPIAEAKQLANQILEEAKKA